MNWLRRLIAFLIGADRYHEQAGAVQDRHRRRVLLQQQLEVYERRGTKRVR